MDGYHSALSTDREMSAQYYTRSVHTKTEQQKALEALLSGVPAKHIADIACGAGGASVHLKSLYPQADFTLLDYNDDALRLARQAMAGADVQYVNGDLCDLPLPSSAFDLVVCWQTLSWIDQPAQALRELIRICRPGGRVYASSLFNLEHDVDIYSRVVDHTRPSANEGLSYAYNTYSERTVRAWVGERAQVILHPFEISIDLPRSGRGLGTYTVPSREQHLQVSAGMLLNWAILELRK